MRPLILLSVNNSWNVVNFRAGLVRRLVAAGYDVGVVSPADAAVPDLRRLGIRHIPLAIDSKGRSPFTDAHLLFQYYAILRRERPIVLLSWTIKPNIFGAVAARFARIPIICNVSGLGTVFIRHNALTRFVELLYRVAFARATMVFFQNSEDRRQFVDRSLVIANRTRLLPGSGINLSRFAPSSINRPAGGPFVFLLVARLLRDKGVREYVEAARTLRQSRPEVRCLLLGAADAINRSAIPRSELDGWTAEGVIEYLGETDDVRPAILAADCVVLPSYREGMPRALLEGAALGKPLIATRVPGCVEIAREGENAILCEPRSSASLTSAMEAMLRASAADRQRMGSAGRRIAVAEFDEEVVADRYLEEIDSIRVAQISRVSRDEANCRRFDDG